MASNFNMGLAVLLLLFILIVGPTVFIFDTLIGATGDYLGGFLGRGFRTGAFGGSEWLGNWTIFYWVWWISWVPFVGRSWHAYLRGGRCASSSSAYC